jgi:FixJ family two-component response regulator
MRSAGYRRVEIFDSAEDFLRHAVLGPPFLLVLDLLLPGMSGIDLQRRLRESGQRPDTVFISANEGELERARTMCPEGLAFLQKPLEEGSLLAAVRSAFET